MFGIGTWELLIILAIVVAIIAIVVALIAGGLKRRK
jgi:hypothetical protein